MTKPWFSDIPEGAPLSAYWTKRNEDASTTLKARIDSKVVAINEAVESGIITKDIGDQRKGEFDKEERSKLAFYDPPSLGKRVDAQNPVFLRDAATGQQIFESGSALIAKIVSGEMVVPSKAMMEFFATDLGVPLERLWRDTIQAEPPPAPPPLPPAPPAVETKSAAATESTGVEDALPPPSSGPAAISEAAIPPVPPPAATPAPVTDTAKPSGKGSRGSRTPAGPPPPAFQPQQPASAQAAGSNGTYPDIHVTNATMHNLLVRATALPSGAIAIRIMPDRKDTAQSGDAHTRHTVVRYQESPEQDRVFDFETVALVVQPNAAAKS